MERNTCQSMLQNHFIAASNIPHEYYPTIARSAVAYAYATQMPNADIRDLVAAAPPELNIDGHTMRHVVYHAVASRLDPSHMRIADDMAPDEWGDMQYAPTYENDGAYEPPNMSEMNRYLQESIFSRGAAMNPDAVQEEHIPGKLDASRIADFEQLRRRGNLEEAIRQDDMPFEENATPTYEQPSYHVPEAPPAPAAPTYAYDLQPMMFPELQQPVSAAPEEPAPAPPAESVVPSAAADAAENDILSIAQPTSNETAVQRAELHEIFAAGPTTAATATTPVEDRFVEQETPMEAVQDAIADTAKEEMKIEQKEQEARAALDAIEKEKSALEATQPETAEEQLEINDKKEQLADAEQKKRDKIAALEEKKKRNDEREAELKALETAAKHDIDAASALPESERQAKVENITSAMNDAREERDLKDAVRKEEERAVELTKKEETLKKTIAHDEAKTKRIAAREAAIDKQPPSPAQKKEKEAIERQKDAVTLRTEQNKEKLAELEEKRKRNAERAARAGDALQKFARRARAEANAFDKETGLSDRAKQETAKAVGSAVDTGIERATKHVERKLDSAKVADTIIAEAAKTDSTWRTITAADRAKLIEETDKQTDAMIAQFEEKEDKDTADIDKLVADKQISDKTGNRIKQVLAKQNTAALNVAIKSFAHSAGAKLGLTSKKFSVLLRELNVRGGKFEKVLEAKIRLYAPKVKETLREIGKGAGALTRETNKVLGPIIKEWLPIIMEQVNKAGSAATTEIINQIPNIVSAVVKTASKSGKSAIGADMDAPPKSLHAQWQQGSVVFEEIVPTDPPGGVYAFPPALDAGDVLRHLASMSKEPGKGAVFWTVYMRLYTYVTQMSRESDDWLKWTCERAPLFLGANPITLSSAAAPVSPDSIAWVHSFAGAPFTTHHIEPLRMFVELVMRGCVSLSEDCKMHARILMRTPAAGIGYENLHLL